MHISANLITWNEERNLEACLRSLRWADEIVVVDGGSRDQTVAIARRHGSRVLVHPFDDFASQRNRALAASRGDWILAVDADERVSGQLAAEIRRAVGQAGPDLAGFWVPIHSWLFGRRFRHGGMQGERKLRLFRRDRARWVGPVHETVACQGKTGRLAGAIIHVSTPDTATFESKLERYSRLEAAALRAAGQPRWLPPAAAGLCTFGKLYFGKLGLLDGPAGLRFCFLAGLNAWKSRLLARSLTNGADRQRPEQKASPTASGRQESRL